MVSANLGPFLEDDMSVPAQVQEAARTAQPGGMEPNTNFVKVFAREGTKFPSVEKKTDDDLSLRVLPWNCTKSLKVGQKEFFYQYWKETEWGPLCFVYIP